MEGQSLKVKVGLLEEPYFTPEKGFYKMTVLTLDPWQALFF